MSKFRDGIILMLAAFILYAVFYRIYPSLNLLVNVFSLSVLYFAMLYGEIPGACAGMTAGLIQDAFSGGVFGISGIAKTIMGYIAGLIFRRINVSPLSRRFIVLFLILVTELVIMIFITSFIFPEGLKVTNTLMFFQPLFTALFGSLLFHLIRKWKRVPSDYY